MKITRHTAKDMRQALKLVREQLGPDAVILTSKRTPFGVEVTAAVDFDAARVEAQAPPAEPRTFRPEEFTPPAPIPQPVSPRREDPYTIADHYSQAEDDVQQSLYARIQAEMLEAQAAVAPRAAGRADGGATTARARNSDVRAVPSPALARAVEERSPAPARSVEDRNSFARSVEDRNSFGRSVEDRSSVGRSVEDRNSVGRSVEDRNSVGRSVEDRSSVGRSVEDRSSVARSVGDQNSFARAVPAAHGAVPAGAALSRPAIEGVARKTAAVVQHSPANDEVHSALESAIDSYMSAGPDMNDEELLNAAVSASNRTDGDDSAMSAELKAMRRILETQMAQLAWNDLTRRAPIHTEILTGLTEVGLSQELAAQIVAQLPAGMDITKARRLSIALFSQRLNVTGDRWLDKGGRIALIGPTGVGKTTSIAKLAVRWVLRHGARSLALISADGVRIGAHDQMQALGQMLDVPVYIADSLAEIPSVLEELGQQRLVLIDTPGMSQRDAQLSTRMEQLGAIGNGLETALVLSASTQAGAIEETVKRYALAKPTSVLLTKVDEAASLGGVLSVLARSEMPIAYVSEGQRVPEDLRPARALELVSRAVQLAKATGAAADEDLLRRRYGDVAHALA